MRNSHLKRNHVHVGEPEDSKQAAQEKRLAKNPTE